MIKANKLFVILHKYSIVKLRELTNFNEKASFFLNKILNSIVITIFS